MVLIHSALLPAISVPVEPTINGGFAVVVRGGIITVNLRAGAAVADGVVAVVVDDGFVAVDQNTDGIRIGNRHTALVVHRGAVAGDINPVTAAADIQRAVLIHYSVITRDFGTGRALTINGGFTVIVHGGFITVNLRAGAAVADGVVAVVVDDGFVTVNLRAGVPS